MKVETINLPGDEEKLLIDGKVCQGNVMEGAVCKQCGEPTVIYENQLDTMFCWSCNLWLEDACSDPACHFCATRPARPLPDILEDDVHFKE